jgi:hypothetical protein
MSLHNSPKALRSALMVAEQIATLTANRDALREALECLYDEQNGAPLFRRALQWQAAMDKAQTALGGE